MDIHWAKLKALEMVELSGLTLRIKWGLDSEMSMGNKKDAPKESHWGSRKDSWWGY